MARHRSPSESGAVSQRPRQGVGVAEFRPLSRKLLQPRYSTSSWPTTTFAFRAASCLGRIGGSAGYEPSKPKRTATSLLTKEVERPHIIRRVPSLPTMPRQDDPSSGSG